MSKIRIYSADPATHELLVQTLRDADMIDAVTPSIAYDDVIADADLPTTAANQAIQVQGERLGQHYTVSHNCKVVPDWRGTKAYRTADGQEQEVKALGDLPEGLTLDPRPCPFHTWSGDGWVLTVEAAHQKSEAQAAERIAQIRANIQHHLDAQAQSMGYDDIKNAVTYADEPAVPKFQQEGIALRAWRSLVWDKGYEVLNACKVGERPAPTWPDLRDELPAYAGDMAA